MFVIIAYKNGDEESHSYPFALIENREEAIQVAEEHVTFRGGKYGCVVYETLVNRFWHEDISHMQEVYRAKSALEWKVLSRKPK